MYHAPGAGLIAGPVDQQSSTLPLCYGCPLSLSMISCTHLLPAEYHPLFQPWYWFSSFYWSHPYYCWTTAARDSFVFLTIHTTSAFLICHLEKKYQLSSLYSTFVAFGVWVDYCRTYQWAAVRQSCLQGWWWQGQCSPPPACLWWLVSCDTWRYLPVVLAFYFVEAVWWHAFCTQSSVSVVHLPFQMAYGSFSL